VLTIPTPDDLDQSPELAVLAVLDAVIESARSALVASHAELRSGNGLDNEMPSHPAVWIASALLDQFDTLQSSLERYRTALRLSAFVALHFDPARAF
jgi:hypothetical protein